MSFEMPTSALPRCLVCGEPIERIALYEIRGFEEPRQQGGANYIVARVAQQEPPSRRGASDRRRSYERNA